MLTYNGTPAILNWAEEDIALKEDELELARKAGEQRPHRQRDLGRNEAEGHQESKLEDFSKLDQITNTINSSG